MAHALERMRGWARHSSYCNSPPSNPLLSTLLRPGSLLLPIVLFSPYTDPRPSPHPSQNCFLQGILIVIISPTDYLSDTARAAPSLGSPASLPIIPVSSADIGWVVYKKDVAVSWTAWFGLDCLEVDVF